MGWKPSQIHARRIYNRERNKQITNKRRENFLRENPVCVKCGSNEKIQADHIDPNYKTTNSMWSLGDEKFALEIAKCQALCIRCHGAKSSVENYKRPPSKHGTRSMFVNHKCRCEDCVKANLEYHQHYDTYQRVR